MTPEERARKISYQFNGRDFQTLDEGRIRELLIENIAAQIAEAEREAVKNAVMTMSNNEGVNIAFKDGFAAAREKAAKIAQKHNYNDGCVWHCSLDIAARIAEMKP